MKPAKKITDKKKGDEKMLLSQKEKPCPPDFSALFEAMPGMYLVLLPCNDFTVIAASDSYIKNTQSKRTHIIGKSVTDVLPDHKERLNESLQRVITYGKPHAMELQKHTMPVPATEGGGAEIRYYEPMNIPVCDKNQKIMYVMHRVTDVTDKVLFKEKQMQQLEWSKRLETTEKQQMRSIRDGETLFRHLTRNLLNYAIFMLDEDGSIVSWNEGAEKLMGYTAEEIVGKHVAVFYMDEEIGNDDPRDNLKVAAANGHYQAERWRLHKDRSRFRAKVILTPLFNTAGKVTGYTSIIQSLSKPDQYETNRSLSTLNI